MADEGFEEWDADFLDQVIKVEERTLSSFNPTQSLFRQPSPAPQPPPPSTSYLTHSPPRELSQRPTVSAHSSNQPYHTLTRRSRGSPSALPRREPKQLEIDRLKNELERMSKQLIDLEHERSELRQERDGQEEKLRSVFSRTESKETGAECMTDINLDGGFHIREHSVNHHACRNTNSSNDHVGVQVDAGAVTRKEVGVQTEKPVESNDLMIRTDLSTTRQCSRKLFDIWSPSSGQQSRRNLVPKLMVACETDFQVLFRCLSSDPSSSMKFDNPTYESSSDVHLNHQVQPVNSVEAAKVSHLYLMLTKIGYDMVKLRDLIEALVDLCGLENVIIVHKALRVLRVLLNHVFRMEKKPKKRDNVMVEMSNTVDPDKSRCYEAGSRFYENATETSQRCHILYETRFNDSANICEDEVFNDGSLLSVSGSECFSVFEKMKQIVTSNNDEHVRLEAVSILNWILMRTNAYMEREKFGQLLALQSVSQLLRKDAGIAVQKQTVHLLYLLLNCPTFLVNFCSGYKEEAMIAEDATNDVRPAHAVLDGLADCLACHGNSAHIILELKLQRNAIILLAFLASSGKCGFEILLGHRLPKRINFFTLILQTLAPEDSKASESIQQDDISKERMFLIREALIFLNRLVSNPQYSTSVLRALTNTRDSASLTIDIANRFSRKGKWFLQYDTMASQTRESEVVDLARVFKKRVFTFLGS